MKTSKPIASSGKTQADRTSVGAKTSPANSIMQLQALVGNRAATQFLRHQVLQSKAANQSPVQMGKKKTSVEDSPQVKKELGVRLLKLKEELSALNNRLAGLNTVEEVEEIIEELDVYKDEERFDKAYDDDTDGVEATDIESIAELLDQVNSFFDEVKENANERVDAIKESAWEKWQDRLAKAQITYQKTKDSQTSKWNQLIQFTPAVAANAEYLAWQTQIALEDVWWGTLPADRDVWYPDRAAFAGHLTAMQNDMLAGTLDLDKKPTNGVHRKLKFNDPGHVREHEKDDVAKYKHGVFHGDAIFMTELAWKNKAVGDGPVDDAGRDKYRISFPNAGVQRGMATTAGYGDPLNYVTIVTVKDSADVVTAYPSN